MKKLIAIWLLSWGSFLPIPPESFSLNSLPLALQSPSKRILITEAAIGPVRLGMRVAQVRTVLRPFTLSRTTDGEGVALIAVNRGNKTVLTLYACEPDPAARINERGVIEFIEAWDPSFRTAGGIHAGMPLREVEQKYGKLKEISLSEIESREFATFANQPKGIHLRVMNENGMAGVYKRGETKTMRYEPGTYVFSISISGLPRMPKFSSAYTDLKTECRNPVAANNEGQHTSSYCKGYGDYRIHIFDSATALHINAETLDRQLSIPLATQNLTYDQQGRKIEWRLADGKPFAVILRVFKYSGNGEYPLQQSPIGEVLLVKGLAGFEQINHEVNVRGKTKANVRARALADRGYAGLR